MTKQGRPKSEFQTTVLSARIDDGVLNEIDRLLSFRYRTPISRELYLRMILYGDEPPISRAVEVGDLTRIDFRLPEASIEEINKIIGDRGNRSDYIRQILAGEEETLTPPRDLDNGD